MGDPIENYIVKSKTHMEASSSSSSLSSICISNEREDWQRSQQAPSTRKWNSKSKKRSSKKVLMCEIPRNIAWEKRRRQEQRKNETGNEVDDRDLKLTDEDMNELKGCIELGFGFNEEDGQKLCPTIPALDLYFAVNRNFACSPMSSPTSSTASSSSTLTIGARSSLDSPSSESDSWKIVTPGDGPQQVKTKLRHWAQAVACSVMLSPLRGDIMESTDYKEFEIGSNKDQSL